MNKHDKIDPIKTVRDAVEKLEAYLLGEDFITAWNDFGAFVITDNEVYEVYTYNSSTKGAVAIVQCRDFEQASGWNDITGNVLK